MNTYLEGREADCDRGLYPRSHLWGADGLLRAGHQVVFVPGRGCDWLSRALRKLTQLTRGFLGDFDQELQLWRAAPGCDIIYVAHGNLFFSVWLRRLRLLKPKLVVWVYIPHTRRRRFWWLKENRWFAGGHDGFCCLTDLAVQAFSEAAPMAVCERIDWAADTQMFMPSSDRGNDGFFFACGRTNRDYRTLLAAAKLTGLPVKILVSRSFLKGMEVSENVEVVEGPGDAQTDRGISYPEMIEKYYRRALAIVIPRSPLPWDTNGFTNLLEALAAGKPVIMTRTGALDFDVEKEGVGFHAYPSDARSMAEAMIRIASDPDLALALGRRARSLAEAYYNLERLGKDVNSFLEKCIKKSRQIQPKASPAAANSSLW